MSSKPRAQKKYDRTSAGLRDALFDELEDLFNGVSTANEAIAFSKLAGNIIASGELDLKRDILEEAKARRLEMEAQRLAHERKYALPDYTQHDNEETDAPVEAEQYLAETPLPNM